MSPYQKLLSIIGPIVFWLCFTSLWADRASQRLDLPFDIFQSWTPDAKDSTPMRAEGIAMIAIYAAWPFAIITLYLLYRIARTMRDRNSRWQRLPAPFGLHKGLQPHEKSFYRLFFLLLFWALPMVHIGVFAVRFFSRKEGELLVFHWSRAAWTSGEDSNGDMFYGGLTYFAWTPLVVIAALLLIFLLNVAWTRELFGRNR